ncbi:MAG: hypothetical protein ACOC5F_04415 [Candidatus Aminicenantaceae bacterium]
MDEAEKIYKAIFKNEIPPLVKQRFLKASEELFSDYSKKNIEEYKRALSKISDLEALEFAARRKSRIPLLIIKFRLMVYMAETVPENSRFFINRKDKKFTGKLSVLWIGMKAVWKYIKGLFLLRML